MKQEPIGKATGITLTEKGLEVEIKFNKKGMAFLKKIAKHDIEVFIKPNFVELKDIDKNAKYVEVSFTNKKLKS